MAQLFHITCLGHIKKILFEDKYLKVVESNIGSPEHLKADPDDPAYEDEMVPIWPHATRPREERMPMVVSGEVLKKMEENCEIYPRVSSRDDIETWLTDENGEPSLKVKMVVDFEPDPNTPPVKFGEHVGPDVVWLTKDPTPVQPWAHTERNLPIEWQKSEVLITVDVPVEDAHKWSTWAFEQGISKMWYDALDSDDGSAENWFVVERPIPMEEWTAIYMAKSGRVFWLNPDKHPDLDPTAHVDGVIKIDRIDEISDLYPKPQAYFASTFRGTT